MWNELNVTHIAEHGVTPLEAEDIVEAARAPFPRAIEDGKFLVWGETKSGRPLQVVFVYQPDEKVDPSRLTPAEVLDFQDGARVVYVIHAMEMSGKMKQQDRRRARRRGRGRKGR